MRISIIGTRGIPSKYGGFETFAEEISVLLVEKGFDVTVQCDFNSYPENRFRNVKLHFSAGTKTCHPLRYYYNGIRWSLNNSDIIFVTGTPGSIFYFMNLFKKKLIITNPDGLEHMRGKWSISKKLFLKISEMLSVIFSDYIIADSENIKKYLCIKYRSAEKKIKVIEYGAYINNKIDYEILKKHSLDNEKYYLVVCRLEPENNLDLICNAHKQASTECPLVIVGNITENRFVKRLINRYESSSIRFIGGVYDKSELNALRFSCKAYIHGHSVGGTNPSLLEAMANHNIIIAHDNVFNREVTSGQQLYFKNVDQCIRRINEIEMVTIDEKNRLKEESYRMIINKYNWGLILDKYLELFREINIK
jgi:glycosyltransferase involved in cell wall biosynthesis